ncbi:MAG: TIM44-like domain-containing protein [Clostridia bacterium]|nr:TIM44-like domain-containing protein [Clostridia bacterium]
MSKILDNLVRQDKDFSESKFKSKVENEFIQIMLSMVSRKTMTIKHFVNDKTYSKIVNKIRNDVNNGRIQIYDELNVAGVDITDIQEDEDCFKIYVVVHSKALEYYLSLATRRYLSGNNTSRTERTTQIVFKKIKDNKELGAARKCPACGANLDINRTGVCSYCGTIIELEHYDWIITDMSI